MSRTSTALKRLGVAGIAVATIGAGVPALIGATAQAATPGPTTQLVITPTSQSGAAGECIIYAITPQDANGGVPSDTQGQTITVNATENPATDTQQLSFCAVTPPHANRGTMSSLVEPTAPAPTQPAFANAEPATPTAANGQNSAGTQYFGLRAAVPGGATIRAFVVPNGTLAAPFNPLTNTGATATATATFTAGGNNGGAPLPNDQTYGGAAAQDAVKSITEVAQDPTATTPTAGGSQAQFVTVQLKNAAGDPVPGVHVNTSFSSSSANLNTSSTGTTPTPVTCVGGTSSTNSSGVTSNDTTPTTQSTTTAKSGSDGAANVSNNQGYITCSYTPNTAGTDTLTIYVNQTCGSSTALDACEPRLTVTRTTAAAPNSNPAQARFIDLTPNGPLTLTSPASQVFTATVTDANGLRVSAVTVCFFNNNGTGRFTGNTCGQTNNFGQLTATFTSVAGETGQTVVSADIEGINGNFGGSGLTQCGQAAGQGTPSTTTTPAGTCQDSTVVNFSNASSSPTPSPTSTATPPPGGKGTLTTSTPDIQPNIQGILNASGLTSGAVYELRCYSRPSTTYFTARSATVSTGSSTLEFRILPGTNTRCYVRPAGDEANASNSVVINVHTTLSLSTVRTGVRTYVFQGRNLPRRSGQLITLYRIANGQEIRTSNLVTDASGIYRVTRTFTGTGTFQFRVRTSQTLTNAAGASNIITVNIH